MAQKRRPHVLVFPFPGEGHTIPLLDLTFALASHGLSITILTTPNNESRLTPTLERAASNGFHIRPLILPLPPTQGVPLGCHNTDHISIDLLPLFIFSLGALADPLEKWILQQQREEEIPDAFGPPVCMISDFFLGWTQHTAAKVGIPRVVFYTSGAFAGSVMHSVWLHMPHEGVPGSDDEVPILIPDLPRPVRFTKSQLSPLARAYRRSEPVSEFVRDSINANLKSWGTLINTFHDLENIYLDHLHVQRFSGRPVWSVGPLLPPAVFEEEKTTVTTDGRKPNSISETVCLQWLDSQSPRSVVYVCFGSLVVLSNTQIQEIAAGLEGIEQGFIWVVKDPSAGLPDAESYGKLPQGFEERSKDKGLVIRGWAPQLSILSHSSVGGFLTHCGWNSTLESIALGVPLIAWPMTADQHANCFLIVEYLKNGVKLCQGKTAVPNRQQLKAAVKRVLSREGEEMKRAEELRKLAKTAVQEGGSSYKNLEAFVSEMQKLARVTVN